MAKTETTEVHCAQRWVDSTHCLSATGRKLLCLRSAAVFH